MLLTRRCWPTWSEQTAIHRLVAADSLEVESIKVLARAHQSLVWTRARHTNQLRSALREYFRAALDIFKNLAERDTLAVSGRAPTPAIPAQLTQRQGLDWLVNCPTR